MNEKLREMLKYLRLRGLLDNWDSHLTLAAEKRWSQAKLLKHIVEQEYKLKHQNAHQLRLKKAKIPERFAIETYPFARQPKLNKKHIVALYDTFQYMRNNQNIIWLGPTGCGKTGMATSFLINAVD